jgi:hypothetical protein
VLPDRRLHSYSNILQGYISGVLKKIANTARNILAILPFNQSATLRHTLHEGPRGAR